MMPVSRGTLRLTKRGKVQVEYQSKKGSTTSATPSTGEVSQTLLEKLKEYEGKEVEFDMVDGQPKRVREVGGTFARPSTGGRSTGHRTRSQATSTMPTGRQDAGSSREHRFHNPYNFVPALKRSTSDPDLGDGEPVRQDEYVPDRYTGRITVRMTAKTPLLVPDTKDLTDDRDVHKTFPLLLDADGRPLVPASSVRGMLRSAYEAVTNSRFGTLPLFKPLENRDPASHKKRAYDNSPYDLLHPTLRPAASLNELSPADRVFGWVRGDSDARDEQTATRGLLRVGPVTCLSEDAVDKFGPEGLPLAILSAPKPQQVRFYLASDESGKAHPDGISKADADYNHPGNGLRGRKVYPHQRSLPEKHWDNATKDRMQSSGAESPIHYQEYRRAGRLRDSQNRSILGWVKPGAQFCFDMHVLNLSQVELGALLWLLSLPADHFLRFGGGKPLGFGSVHLSIEAYRIRTGADLRQRYSSWIPREPATDPGPTSIEAYKEAVVRAHVSSGGGGFESVPFITAFLAACRGFEDDLPIHYPRATEGGRPGPPLPDGESFRWFVANEKGRRCALPDLVGDPGLPYLRSDASGKQRGRRS